MVINWGIGFINKANSTTSPIFALLDTNTHTQVQVCGSGSIVKNNTIILSFYSFFIRDMHAGVELLIKINNFKINET